MAISYQRKLGDTGVVVDSSTGYVGIGTNDPDAKLHVSDATGITIENTSTTNVQLKLRSNGTDTWRIGQNLVVTGATALEFYDDVNNVDRMVITNSGNVGIGVTAPVANLHIKGSDPILLVQDDSTGTVDANATLRLGESGAGGVLDQYWDIKQAPDDLNTHLEINHSSAGNAVAVTSDLKVGIGVTTPAAKLHVVGDISGSGEVRVQNGYFNPAIADVTAINAQPPTTGDKAVIYVNRGYGSHKGSGIYIVSANYTNNNNQAFVELNAGSYSGIDTRYIHAYDSAGTDFVVYGDGSVVAGKYQYLENAAKHPSSSFQSPQEIIAAGLDEGNGLYYINPGGQLASPIQVYVDFTTPDAQGETGWMLVASFDTDYTWGLDSTSTAAALSTTAVDAFSANFGNYVVNDFRVHAAPSVDSGGTNSSGDWYYHRKEGIEWKKWWSPDNSGLYPRSTAINPSFRDGLIGFDYSHNIKFNYTNTAHKSNGLSDLTGTIAYWDVLTTAGGTMTIKNLALDGTLGWSHNLANTGQDVASQHSIIGYDDNNATARYGDAFDTANVGNGSGGVGESTKLWLWVKGKTVRGGWTDGDDYVYTENTGSNVGIGTRAPDAKLHVNGNIRIPDEGKIVFGTAGTPNDYLELNDVNSTGKLLKLVQDGNTRFDIEGVTGDVYAQGSVGIGVLTPGAQLDVVGPAGGDPIFKLQRNGVAAYDYFISDAGAGAAQLFQRALNNDTGFIFQTKNSGGSAVNALTIAPSGNVGIGTTEPSAPLAVHGQQKWYTTNADGNELRAFFNPGGSGDSAEFSLYQDNASTVGIELRASGNSYFTGGSVGIGITSPSYKLHVDGDIGVNANDAFKARYTTNENYHSSFRWAGLQLGNNGANKIVAGRTNTGGYFQFWVNNTNDASDYNVTPDGTKILTLAANGTSTFTGGVTATSFTGSLQGNITGTAASETLATVTGRGNNTNTALTLGAQAPLNFTYTGTGTYNKTVLYHNSTNGYMLELAKVSDSNVADPINFHIGTRGGGYNPLFITGSTGYVGINNATPEFNLHVDGTARVNDTTYLATDANSFVNIGAPYVSTTTASDTKLILQGKNVTDTGTNYYGDFGQILLWATSNYSSSSRRFLITNALGVNKFAIIRSVDASTTPTIGQGGDVANGYADFVIDYTGNVGIGTDSPLTKLHIKDSGTPTILFEAASGATQTAKILYDQSGQNKLVISTQYPSPTDGNLIQFAPADSVAMTIRGGTGSSNGFVGIGTSSPATRLEVNSGGTGAAARFTGTANFSEIFLGTNGVQSQYTNVVWYTNSGNAQIWKAGTGYTSAGGASALNIYNSNGKIAFHPAGNFNAMTIDTTTNVGIGSTAPAAKLNVVGGADVLVVEGSGSAANNTIMAVDGTSGRLFEVSDDLSDSLFSVNTIAGLPVLEVFADNRVVAGAYNQNDFVISGSRVGIGITNPSRKLEVNGDFEATQVTINNEFTFPTVDGSSGQALVTNGSGTVSWGTVSGGSASSIDVTNRNTGINHRILFIDETGTSGETIYVNDGGLEYDPGNSDLKVSGNVISYASSDRRLKDNLKPIERASEKISKIGGYEFDWNDKQTSFTGHDVGVVAQEIEEVLPEVVSTNENGYKAVKYEKIVALLIEGMKEQQKEIKELKERINQLEK